jgi:pilus assembly protein FimV
MPRDEPTVESDMMNFAGSPTTESPTLKSNEVRERLSSKLGAAGAEQTAEVSIDDLGLDLDGLEDTDSPAGESSKLEATDHPSDAPTMLAGLDERSRRMMAEAESRSRERDLTELERELEASFISELEASHDEFKTAIIAPESAPTVEMLGNFDSASTSRFKATDVAEPQDVERADAESTSRLRGIGADTEPTNKLRGINPERIDVDMDRLGRPPGSSETVDQPRAAEDLFSSEVFEASQRSRVVDLDVGEAINGADESTTRVQGQNGTAKTENIALPEFEPVTMSEVGTKLDLARAYMDMGDPEGARSILEEVMKEGSASQKQEAQRLIESLPG